MATKMTGLRLGAAAAAMVAMAAAAQAQELVVNGGFEQGTDGQPGAPGWTNFNANFTVGEQAHNQGGKSFKAFGPFYTADPPAGSGAVQKVPVTAGLTYTFSGFLLSPAGDKVRGLNLGLMELSFLDAGNANIGGTAASARYDANSPADVWIPFTFDRTAPVGATQANIFIGHIQINDDPALYGGAIFFDDVSLKVAVPSAESNWIATSSGGWLSASNWQNGVVPNAVGAVANFGTSITAPTTVTIAGAGVTSGTVRFNNAANAYTVAGPGTLTLDVTSGSAALTVTAGSHAINAPLVINDSTVATVATGQTLSLGGALTLNNGAQLSATGGGTLRLASSSVTGSAGAAAVANGGILQADADLGNSVDVVATAGEARLNATQHIRSLSIASNAKASLPDTATSHVVRTPTVNLDANGTLELGDNAVIIDYTGTSPAAAIRAAIIVGKNGNFVGKGITSTKAADQRYSVGYAEANKVSLTTSVLGEGGFDATTLIVRSTLKGDSTVNGTVDFDDLVALAQNYQQTTGKVWSDGDFDYDGDVDFDDLVPLAQNYNSSVSLAGLSTLFGSDFSADWALAQSIAPEPASMMALMGASTLVLRRRRAAGR